MSIEQTPFGNTPDGTPAIRFTLTNQTGVTVKVTNYGGRITEIHAPDRNGESCNIALGFDSLDPYLQERAYLGATIGRFANRIAKGKFTLDGQEYTLPANNGPNSLHGGHRGFHAVMWNAVVIGQKLQLTHFSPDGDEGYPGNLQATTTFELNDTGELRIDFEATCDQPTPVNMTNHSYFNLSGAGNGTILDHVLTLHAPHFTPVDQTLIPTGEIASVKGTPMDFTTPRRIGDRISEVGIGYDHNLVLRSSGKLALAAALHDPASGRALEVLTTQPGIQFYSGNFLDGLIKGLGGAYIKHGGLCLETQHFPDSPNQPKFPNTILRPGERYHETAVYRFVVR